MKIPDAPLQFIKECVMARRIYWTYHVNMRLLQRYIPRSWILLSIDNYILIESYPKDKYLPSYLIWSVYESVIFHILFGVDVEENHVRIITAYKPDPDEWTNSLQERRIK
jgi:hypothetical protein